MRCTEVSGGRIAREGVFPVCTHCGSALPDRPLVREGKVYCRARCILDGLPVGHRPGFQDERYAGLAEVGAIVRSHEERFDARDRKSTRLNSSHHSISYAVFCLKKKN